VSSDKDKNKSGEEQELLKELASILTETGGTESKPSAGSGQMAASHVDQDMIRELAALLSETGLTEIEVDQNGMRVRVARTAAVQSVGVAPAPMAAAPAPAADSGAAPTDSLAGAVTSPMVGTAYVSPEPGAAAFVQEGDTVSKGQTLLIVEAMKTMNPIPAPRAGKVTRVLVNDGQPVEFGEPLLVIE